MKLYSRNQLLFFSVISAVVTAIVIISAGLLGFVQTPNGENRKIPETLLFEQIPPAANPDIMPVQAAGDYTEDELENITVYERLNEGVVNITTETIAYSWFFDPVPQEGGDRFRFDYRCRWLCTHQQSRS